MHIHLDLLGGLAGDMLIAALLDAFPEHEQRVVDTIARLATQPSPCRRLPHHDGVLAGSRFEVLDPSADHAAAAAASPLEADRRHAHGGAHGHDHDHLDGHHGHGHGHAPAQPAAPAGDHVAWSSIEPRLRAALPASVAHHAIGIFQLLAEAEGQVHGVPAAQVQFHEVGAWDSIADIVGAAVLIDALAGATWSAGPIPLGAGRVHTAHGWMPVPTPATALLLRGFDVVDDGIGGERVTPTGAALLGHLMPRTALHERGARRPGRIARSGTGFGTRRLPGISNCVRALVFDEADAGAAADGQHRELAVVEFEVDDLTAEELATGLDRLRAHADVFDVLHAPVVGKKGRVMSAVRVLARPVALADVIDACFRETTTIGLRHHTEFGAALPRQADTVTVAGRPVRVKTVERPGGRSAKAESDDALATAGLQARRALRHQAEQLALAQTP